MSPALFATLVLAPVVAVHVVMQVVTAPGLSWELLSVLIIYAAFWLSVFAVWRRTGRRRP
ncbi:hypothetical protein C5C18_14645 [Rathayibacter tritici]|nr:hypothetical protein [Rathayibacter tritici]PPF23611.1 hypothetical protein C5C06_13975 [Rathayibacter tritici]PPF63276.1 hypothetical protein C5C21_13230 [Rathayibacter tritici]PPG02235.1 hypothetical protein C5C18_14645 [Rathayibacter tritici]PPI17892.1 hypothetical protein C5D07_04375 [Rathayibacter tritici]PPI47167.1 hypothetical protein C5D18_04365 [Rathayibacter tritici]